MADLMRLAAWAVTLGAGAVLGLYLAGWLSRAKVYLDWHDWWVGYYLGKRHHYVCLLPCLVIRWRRK